MDSDSEETWRRALLRFREEKDSYFKQDSGAPIPHSDRDVFSGLHYFDPDPSFRVEARLVRHQVPGSVIMATSKGTRQLYNRVGQFDLVIAGQEVKLQAYQSAEREDP